MPERGVAGEKRSDQRKGIDRAMRFSLVETGEIRDAVARDFSPSGLSIETREPVPVGAILEVAIAPAQEGAPPIKAVVEIVRMDSMRDDLFRLGAVIRDLKPAGTSTG